MKPLILQSDFGYADGAVSAMYGVAESVCDELRIFNLTHDIPPYDIWEASYRLTQTVQYWPAGSVFVSVVDPGVGSARRSVAVRTAGGQYIITPDNGTLTHIDRYFGIVEVREIDETINRLHREDNGAVSVFHGRDLFGYCAARLVSGKISYEEVGPLYDMALIRRHEITEPVIREGYIEGMFEINDPNFGNLWTNIPLQDFLSAGFKMGDNIRTLIYHNGEKVFDRVVPYYDSFGKAPDHSVMIYNNELNKMAMAEVVGNLCKDYNLSYGQEYKVVFQYE